MPGWEMTGGWMESGSATGLAVCAAAAAAASWLVKF